MTTLEELKLPLDEEAEHELEELANISAIAPLDADDAQQLEAEHEARLARALADSERLVIGIGRAYLRDGRALERLARQRDLLLAEIASLEDPIVARRREAEGFLQRVALMQREASRGKEGTLTIPTVGKVKTTRKPFQVKVGDAVALIAELESLEESDLDTLAPYEAPRDRERKVDAAAVKKHIATLVDAEVAALAPEQLAHLAKLTADEREAYLDTIRAHVAATYAGLTFEPTQIGATIEVNA